MHQKVSGSMHNQNIYPGCAFNPQSGQIQEETNQYFSHSLSLSLPLSLESVGMYLPVRIKKKISNILVSKKKYMAGQYVEWNIYRVCGVCVSVCWTEISGRGKKLK